MKQNMKRCVAYIIAYLFVVAMFCSFAFLAKNVHHNCTGEDCPICQEIQMVESVIQKIGTAVILVAVSLFAFVQAQNCGARIVSFLPQETPIKLKVKLLN